MCDLESIIPILKATILSTNGSVSIEQCNRDYKELQGEWIPYNKLGFKSLEELFDKIPGFRLVKQSNGKYLVEAKTPEEVKHITEMIAKQKMTPHKKSYKRHIQRPVRHIRSDSSWKPGVSSNTWRYSKSPTKVPLAYDKPKAKNSIMKSRNEAKETKPSTNHQNSNASKMSSSNNNQNFNASKVVTSSNNQQNSNTSNSVASSTNSQRPVVNRPSNIIIQNTPAVTHASSTTQRDKTSNSPISTLSGFRPGDILARSLSSPVSGPSNKSDNKMEAPLVRLSAADRMSALQNRLQKSEPMIIPRIEQVETKESPKPSTTVSKEILDAELKNLKDNFSRLTKCCELMNLPIPIFRTSTTKEKHGTLYDCTVKIGNKYSFNTYPDSLRTLDLARETAANKALERLQKLILDETQPVSDPNIALSRIIKDVILHPNGLWADNIPDMYKNQYQERLPSNWLSLVEQCTHISKEEGANGMPILLPIDPNQHLEPTSPSSSIEMFPGPQPLQYPDEKTWNLYVMSAPSTAEIWVRFVGEMYSDAFESLTTDMELHYMVDMKPTNEVVEGGWYALNCEDSWMRARVLEVDYPKKSALCFLVDSGAEETYPLNEFYDLPPQFLNLAPQAVVCRLAGLEEYGGAGDENSYLAEMLVGKVFVAEVLQFPDENDDDPTITVVLFDTSTEIDKNMNKELLHKISQEAKAPQLPPGVSEVYITDVTHSGKICVQIHNESWRLLKHMMQQVVSGPFPKEALQASFGPIFPSPTVNYLAKSCTGEWLRAVLRSGINDDSSGVPYLSVRFIDCGRTEKVPVKDIIMLERISSALNKFPAQVLYLALHNVSNLTPELMEKLNSLVPRNAPVLCKQITPGVVELFVRTQPHNILCSVNNALVLERELADKLKSEKPHPIDPLVALSKKKERIFSLKNSAPVQKSYSVQNSTLSTLDTVSQYSLPSKGSYFDIHITLAANPYNFVVQPLKQRYLLHQLMTDLQDVCKKLTEPPASPSVGNVFAVYYSRDSSWYRASILGMVSQTMASLYFIDFGDHYVENIENLRTLPSEFKSLPAMAIKAKLHGVCPVNRDWSVTDCIRFQELVKEQSFVSVVEDYEVDPINKMDTVLVLNVIDTSTSEDLYLNLLLAQEGRAVLNT